MADEVYADATYFVRMKARLMAGFAVLLIVFVPLNILKILWVQPSAIGYRMAFNAIFLIAALICLWCLKRGRLTDAGQALVGFMMIPINLIVLSAREFHEPLGAATSLFVFNLVDLP